MHFRLLNKLHKHSRKTKQAQEAIQVAGEDGVVTQEEITSAADNDGDVFDGMTAAEVMDKFDQDGDGNNNLHYCHSLHLC